jgi:hypothetical protein
MLFYFKKYILPFIALISICFSLNGQTSVGIAGTVTITPSNTVTNSTPVSFIGNFKNTGGAPLTATVVVNLAINTSTAALPNYVFRNSSTYAVTALAAGGTHTFSISDVVSTANQYQTDGNGTTVVVWPYIVGTGSVSTSDSAFTTVFIDLQSGVEEEREFESTLLKIENPVTKTVTLQYDQLIYCKVELMDLNGKVVRTIDAGCLNIPGLAKGLYYLNCYNSKTGRVVVKKILIQ